MHRRDGKESGSEHPRGAGLERRKPCLAVNREFDEGPAPSRGLRTRVRSRFDRQRRTLRHRGRRPTLASGSAPSPAPRRGRSEEHTSELQSRGHIVCRLLLEKKKKPLLLLLNQKKKKKQ